MSKGSNRRLGTNYSTGYDGIDWGRKEEPKPSGGQIWMRKSAMEQAYFTQTAEARALTESAAKTCQHCKHWASPFGIKAERCNNIKVVGMLDADDWRCIEPPADWGCNSWEAKT